MRQSRLNNLSTKKLGRNYILQNVFELAERKVLNWKSTFHPREIANIESTLFQIYTRLYIRILSLESYRSRRARVVLLRNPM